MTNLALIGGVVVLLLVFLKMRRSESGGGKASAKVKAPKGVKPSRAKATPDGVKKPAKGLKFSLRRGGSADASESPSRRSRAVLLKKTKEPAATSPAADWSELAEVAATTEPQIESQSDEPDWDAMRADATGPREVSADPVEAIIPAPPAAAAWEPTDIVTAPGWPQPGDVDVAWDATAKEPTEGSWSSAPELATDVDEVSDWLGADSDETFDAALAPVADLSMDAPEADTSWDALVTPDLADEALAATQISGDTPTWITDEVTAVPSWDAVEPNGDDLGKETASANPEAPADIAEALVAATWEPELAATVAPAEATWFGADTDEPTDIEIDAPFGMPNSEDVTFEVAPIDPDRDADVDEPSWEPASALDLTPFAAEADLVAESDVTPTAFAEMVAWAAASDGLGDEPESSAEAAFELVPVPASDQPVLESPGLVIDQAWAMSSATEVAERVEGTIDAPLEMAASGLTGRFALGGFAVEAGHTALSSAMFREPLVTVPTRWSIANGSAYAPGTIVLHIEATLNCEASDLQVAMEPAFAPTAYGATLRLAARGEGPFAASGTFQLIP